VIDVRRLALCFAVLVIAAGAYGCGGGDDGSPANSSGAGQGGEGGAVPERDSSSEGAPGGRGGMRTDGASDAQKDGDASDAGPCTACDNAHRACDADSGICGNCLPGFMDVMGTCQCPMGQIPEANRCVNCADNFTPNCSAAGETGHVLRKADGVCLCETIDGYFFSLESNTAQPCDNDNDGWITDSAQPVIESTDPVLRDNARCNLRRIREIVLENEAGTRRSFAFGTDFPDGFPLYESARNDGAPSAIPPGPYGDKSLPPRALNSLTKACVSKNGDYNDNGIPDVGEWSGKPLQGRATRNARLQGYYQRYLRFSYFLELHDGWFEDDMGSLRYHIRERARTGAPTGVPVKYPNVDPYWMRCARHVDRDYIGMPSSYAGADFVEVTQAWDGMAHHSQFKCVEIMSETDYGSAYSREKNPEIVYAPSSVSGFARRATAGAIHTCPRSVNAPGVELDAWTANKCSALDATTPPPSGAGSAGPVFAQVNCLPLGSQGIDPGVYWTAVGYENYACESTDFITAKASDYTRGCINECAEIGVKGCKGYDPTVPPGSARFTCVDEDRAHFGQLVCGCGRNYGGSSCEIGCPGESALMVANFSIALRKGYWMCGGTQASSDPSLKGGNYSLFGYVPVAPGGSDVLTTPDKRYRLEAK
jgi:hypothetical protein